MTKSNPRAQNLPIPVVEPVGFVGNSCATPPDRDSEREWRVHLLDDDPAATDDPCRLCEDLGALIQVAIQRLAGNSLDLEEAIQESWLVLLAHVAETQSVRFRSEIPSWLAVVVRNRLADLERQARRRATESLAFEDANALIGREEDPAVVFERNQSRAEVRAVCEAARDRVSESTYRIIVLHWIEGCPYDEIATTLGIPLARVRDRHRRAFPMLRDLLTRRFRSDSIGLPPIHEAGDPLESTPEEVTP
jgi:RNA polymerase sigma-70 factor (ECF subfamily)